MTRFVRFVLQQRVFFHLLFVLLMVAGAWAMLRAPVERYPNIHFGKVFIDTYYPGASPQDVDALVTRKIEDALEEVDHIEYVLSHSYRERSSILVKFEDDTDYARGYDEVRFKVQSIVKDLPATIDPPRFNELDVNDWFPAISVNILGDRSNRTLSLIAKDFKTLLKDVPGLKEIKLLGEYKPEYHLRLDPEKLRRAGVTFAQVAQALRQTNVIVPAGDVTAAGSEFMLRVDERFRSRRQVLDTVVRMDGDGAPLRVRDLAESCRLAYRDPFIVTSVNGKDCVSLQLIKTRWSNAISIVEEVRRIVERHKDRYRAEGVEIILTQDSTVKIHDSIRVLGANLLLGIVLVSALIYLVMGPVNAGLTTIGIPFSFLVTMAVMHVTGNSINEVSLFAFVLVSGIIVDDAIVVVENIYRHRQQGKTLDDAVVDGTAEVLLPICSATATTIAAFLPMLIMTGSVGEFFAIIPKAVTYALLASLVECLFILPIHYVETGARFSQQRRGRRYRMRIGAHRFVLEDTRALHLFRRVTNRLMFLVLRFPRTCLALLAVAFAVAMAIALLSLSGRANLIRITFFPDDYTIYYVEAYGPVGTPIETTHRVIKQLGRAIMAGGPGEAVSAQGVAGFYLNEDYYPIWGNHLGHVVVQLPSRRDRRFRDNPENDILAHLDNMRRRLAPIGRANGFRLRIRAEKDGPPEGRDVNVRILGIDQDAVQEVAGRIMTFLRHDPKTAPWLIDLRDDQGQPGRVVRLHVDQDKAREYGLAPDQVALVAATALNGQVVGSFRLNDEEIDLKVALALSADQPFRDLLQVPLIDRPDGILTVGDLCTPRLLVEPGFLNRFQQRRSVTLTADLRPGCPFSASYVRRRVSAYFQTIAHGYPGITLNFSGEYESTHRSYTSLEYAFIVAVLAIYLILATQFGSYVQPLIILSAVVYALTGVIYGTFFSRTLFTINSFIAIVGVTGVVVNDSLVLVEFINKAYRRGLDRSTALLYATNVRLRPILVTTLTTTLGLMPMALGIPEYSLVWGTMAMTFVTGLCSATFLTLLVVPLLWGLATPPPGGGSRWPGPVPLDIEEMGEDDDR